MRVSAGTVFALAVLCSCASLKLQKGRRAVGVDGATVPNAKSQKNPVASYPDPSAPSRYRGLHFLGENGSRNLVFLSEVETVTDTERHLEMVKLELVPDRGVVKISDGQKLGAPGPEVPFTLRHLSVMADGSLWFSDGEAPGLFKYGKDGEPVTRWVPHASGLGGVDRLPAALKAEPFGPIFAFDRRLYLFGETALGEKTPWARVLEWDPGIGLLNRAHFYPLDTLTSRVVGAAVVTKDRFLVAEAKASGSIRVYRADFAAATEISTTHWMDPATSQGFGLGYASVRPAVKTPLFDLPGEGELDGFALVDYHTIAALRSGPGGAEIWLQRLEGKAITAGFSVDNPTARPEMSKAWVRPLTETL